MQWRSVELLIRGMVLCNGADSAAMQRCNQNQSDDMATLYGCSNAATTAVVIVCILVLHRNELLETKQKRRSVECGDDVEVMWRYYVILCKDWLASFSNNFLTRKIT